MYIKEIIKDFESSELKEYSDQERGKTNEAVAKILKEKNSKKEQCIHENNKDKC